MASASSVPRPLARIMYDYAFFCTYACICSMASWSFILDTITVFLVLGLLQGATKGNMALLILTVEFAFKRSSDEIIHILFFSCQILKELNEGGVLEKGILPEKPESEAALAKV